MGIGSPRLRTFRAACALPVTVVACLIGAPAAFADTVDALSQAPTSASATLMPAVTDVASTFESTAAPVASTPTTAVAAASSRLRAAPNVRRGGQSVLARWKDVAEHAVSVAGTATIAPAVTAADAGTAARAPLTTRERVVRQRVIVRGVTATSAAASRGPSSLRSRRMPAVAERTPARTSVAYATGPDPVPGRNVGPPADLGATGSSLLPVGLFASAAFAAPPTAPGRRIAPGVRALRPSPPLLRIERPD